MCKRNANFADYGNYSSLINTSRCGHHDQQLINALGLSLAEWRPQLDVSGVNGGYDSRPMNTGDADTGVNRQQTSAVCSSSRWQSMQKRSQTAGTSMLMP